MGTLIEQITYIDIAVIVVLLVFAISNTRKGFAGALLWFLPTLLGILLSWKMSAGVIKYVRGTAVFPFLSTKINNGLNIESILPDLTLDAQNEIISGMNVPDVIKNALVTNNNSVIYNIFDAQTLQEYVAGFLTNVIISVAVVILLFIIGVVVGKIVLKILDVVNDIPVIGFFSRAGGLIVGIVKGICVIWILGIAVTFFCTKPWAQEFIAMLEMAPLAGWLYKNNMLLYVVLQIIA